MNVELIACDDEGGISCEGVHDITGETTVSNFVDGNTGVPCVLAEFPNMSLSCFSEKLVKAGKSDVVGCLDILPGLLVKSEVLEEEEEEVVVVVMCCTRVSFGC